jgi:hypothetical protein
VKFCIKTTSKWSVFAYFEDANPEGTMSDHCSSPHLGGKNCDLAEFPSKKEEKKKRKGRNFTGRVLKAADALVNHFGVTRHFGNQIVLDCLEPQLVTVAIADLLDPRQSQAYSQTQR